ncbi:MAG: glycoside hydrolase family 5 protein [Armatimonadota bacterium]|nr:glycoside hydrolase family 5 protein [Armatimonadota bacterium]
MQTKLQKSNNSQWITAAAAIAACVFMAAPAADAAPLPFTGTNLSGGEFGSRKPGVPATFNKDFTLPTENEFNYFASKGMNIFRIPFRWEDLQPALGQPLDMPSVNRLKDVVTTATSKGLYVILDPHNYARYYDDVVGGPKFTSDNFGDFWGRLADQFKDNPRVWFGLVNEPHDMPTQDWFNAAQAAITSIRKTGAKNTILVPGNGWTGAHSWIGAGNDILLKLVDPLNQCVFEAHQYLDTNNSGTHPDPVSTTIGSERLKTFTDWCRRNHKKAFLGEFGVGASDKGRDAINDMLTAMEKDSDVWLGFTWWSAGPWWGNYMFTIEPENLKDRPQMSYLKPHLHGVPMGSYFKMGPALQ